MTRTMLGWAIAALAAGVGSDVSAYDAESYTSAKCGVSMAIPAGSRGQLTESMGSDGFCKIDLAYEGVELHAVTTKDTTVTLAELEKWVVKYTGIGADKWSKFDEGTAHIGYKARTGSKIIWTRARASRASPS